MNAKPQLMVAAALDTVELMAYAFSATKDLLAQLLALKPGNRSRFAEETKPMPREEVWIFGGSNFFARAGASRFRLQTGT